MIVHKQLVVGGRHSDDWLQSEVGLRVTACRGIGWIDQAAGADGSRAMPAGTCVSGGLSS